MIARLGRYEIERLIGKGGTGRVFLALDPKLSRQVAIKVLDTETKDSFRRRFHLEAKAIAALKHPNIVAMYDFSGEDSKQLYLVMEYVPGKSLWQITNDHGPMSEATALCAGHEIALGLEHAHAHNVVHRDIKPENILLHEGRVVVTDFGGIKFVAAEDPERYRRTEALGTPGFMAPEQFDGRDIGPHTDIFSLGAVLYNLATGEVPYQGENIYETYKNLKTGRYVDPRQHCPVLSPEFVKLLSRCLARRIKDRYANVKDLRETILELLSRQGVVEIRAELVRYEQSPAGHAVSQRQREVGMLLRELREAIVGRQRKRVADIIQRIQDLAPLDERIAEVVADAGVPMAEDAHGKGWAVLWFALGLGVGTAATSLIWRLM
ncbi:MAG: hypothetical protein A2341_13095 [Deltaproteobacteria bacterium RIFOXYB12_FULL_58_9]|nr:MAG: hypothetical protein A2341_13095 [Deltaproteobacteria bacterium RIFOXYB12_FULL_58_9]